MQDEVVNGAGEDRASGAGPQIAVIGRDATADREGASPTGPISSLSATGGGVPDDHRPVSWLTELERALCANLTEIVRFRLVRVSAHAHIYLGLGQLRSAQLRDGRIDAERARVARAVVDFFRERDLTVYPALYAEEQWETFEHTLPGEGWLGCFGYAGGKLCELQQLRELGPHPRRARRWLLRLLRAHEDVLEALRASAELPAHVALRVATSIQQDALELLFALEDQTLPAGHELIGDFARFAALRSFDPTEAYLAFELEGLACQAEHQYRIAAARDEEPLAIDPRPQLDRVSAFVKKLRRHVIETLTTADERKQIRRRWQWAGAAAGILALLGVGLYLWLTQPLAPITDLSVITKPGAIVGRYYRGKSFNTFAFSRNDEGIRIHTVSAIDPRVGADQFSVRWEGYLHFSEGGRYQLCLETDDGGRLFFDGKQISGEWSDHPARRQCSPVRVRQGWYPLRFDFYERGGMATARLLRGTSERGAVLVPAKDLCCRAAEDQVAPSAP